MTEQQAETIISHLWGIRILLRCILIIGLIIYASHTLYGIYGHR